MKIAFLLLFCAALVTAHTSHAAEPVKAPVEADAPDVLATLKPTHPRLLVDENSWARLKMQRAGDAQLDAFLRRQEIEARALLNVEPVAYKKVGRRLLGVSRTVLKRVMLLSMQYRLTGDRALLDRAKVEMLSVAKFDDWNPSHFLDVAEMTAALSLGYDWLYDDLDAPTRAAVAGAIREKGLQAGLKNKGWVKATNNWNSVCNAGMVLGSLAIAEDDPAMAAHFVNQAFKANPRGLEAYAPDGVYPEGPGYWAYGTTFQVMLIGALESALGSDAGLSRAPGFLPSVSALFHGAGPSGKFFNYSDSGESNSFDGTTFWFAQRLKQPALAQLDAKFIANYLKSKPAPNASNNRTLPLAALWWPTETPKAPDLPLNWMGDGSNPLASFRSSWNDAGAMFLALKGGKATNSHGHMDAGSFIFESDGVRWARDLGSQNYESLESKQINLWDFKQSGDRWRVFRLGPFSHNTLTINGGLHNASGDARITRFSAGPNAGAVVNLSAVFPQQAQRVTRGFSFRAGQDVTIRDELSGLQAGDQVRFALVTKAQIVIADDGQSATLTEGGKKLTVRLTGADVAQWEAINADPPNDTDAPNPNTRILLANFTAPASGKLNWSVTLQPGSTKVKQMNPLAQTELAKWPMTKVEK